MNKGMSQLIKFTLTILISFAAFASEDFDLHRPHDIENEKWSSLKMAVQTAKLLPGSRGIGGEGGEFGYAVAVDGTRALVGGPNLTSAGAVLVFEFDGANWVEVATLLASDGKSYDQFGISVSLEGDRALVGAIRVDGISGSDGGAYVFDYDGDNWLQTQKLTAVDGNRSDRFGIAVSLSANRAAVGSVEEGIQRDEGSVYVFDFDGSTWNQSQRITAAEEDINNQFGFALSLSDNWLMVGSPEDDANGSSSGSVYVFERLVDGWSEKQKLITSNGGANEEFGIAMSISDDQVLIGTGAGGAYLFSFDGSDWSELQKLISTDGSATAKFGYAVSLDGDRAVVGDYGFDENGQDSGAAFVFDFDGKSWAQSQKLTANAGTADDQLGFALGLSGHYLMLGAKSDSDNGTSSGAAYAYLYNGTNWQQSQKINATEGAVNDYFGVAISLSGETALIGATGDDDNGENAGAAYVFNHVGNSWEFSQKLLASDGSAGDGFGAAVNVLGTQAFVGATGDDDRGSNSGSVYVYHFDGAVWGQTQKLIANIGGPNERLGNAISSWSDRVLVGASGADDFGFGSGAAYVFEYSGMNWSESQRLVALFGDELDRFGTALSLEHNRIVVGASGHGSRGGGAFVFEYDGFDWVQTHRLISSDGRTADFFGSSVSLSGDRVLIGASGTDNLGPQTGSAYVFDFNGVNWVQDQKITIGFSTLPRFFGSSVGLSGDRAVIGAREDSGVDSRSGTAYVYNYDGFDWVLDQKIEASDGVLSDAFGETISLSGGRVLIGANQDDDRGTASGSAYIFDLVPHFNVDVSVVGLVGGTLNLTNGSHTLTMNTDATQTISVLPDGSSFDVTISLQPTSPNQICAFTNANTGTLDGSSVTVTIECLTTQYEVSLNVTGLLGDAVRVNNGKDMVTVTSDGTYIISTLDDGSEFNVEIAAQPSMPAQVCGFEGGGSGVLSGKDVLIDLVCESLQYSIGGTVIGLAQGNSVTLSLNNGDEFLVVNADGSFEFINPLIDGSNYVISVENNPTSPNQTCYVIEGSGVLVGMDVEDVMINCETNQYAVGGIVTGLNYGNDLVLQINGVENLLIEEDGSFVFVDKLLDEQNYSVIIYSQPNDPIQFCELLNGVGIVVGENVNDMTVNCALSEDLIYRNGFEVPAVNKVLN